MIRLASAAAVCYVFPRLAPRRNVVATADHQELAERIEALSGKVEGLRRFL
jgi:hypothetical protein